MNPSIIAVGLPLILFSIPATVLAWVAAGRIHHSPGKLRGRRLAVLCGMLLPSLLAVPALAIGAAIVDITISGHPRPDDATNIILGIITMATSATIALLGIRTCFRHLRRVPKNVLSTPVRITAATVLTLWIATGGLLWVQRPVNVGNTITTQSPDRPFSITASTLQRSHVFGSDLLTYHFEIVGANDTVRISKEILVPLHRLAKHPESFSNEDYYFNSTDAITWAKEGEDISATIKIQGITIHQITIPPDGHAHFKTSD
ncbi:MAG: hypothetical protein P8J87_10745 [Verrucomicrobiales bacterium]|nr:hypothetical protein [Verrucomicrobiales bacterium]